MAIGAVIVNANSYPWNFPHRSGIHVNPAKLRVKLAVRCNVSAHNTRLQNLALQEATHAAALRFQESQQPEVGAKTSRSSLFWHIPAELSELQERLRNLGYKGDKPSIWAVQGFYPMTSDRLGEILYQISCLAMKGSHFVGELPLVAVEPDSSSEEHEGKWIEKVFKRNGFSVDIVSYAKVASDLREKYLIDGTSLVVANDGGQCRSVLFVAQQQRLSDDQVDFVRREMELAEESGDEEGFEDM